MILTHRWRSVRGKLREYWQPLVDVALAVATGVLFVLSGAAVSAALAVAQLLPLPWRRRFPGVVLLIVGVATAAHTTLGMARAVGLLPATIALYTAATHRSGATRWALCPAVAALLAVAGGLRHGFVEGALLAAGISTVAWLAGVERSAHLRQRTEAARARLERRIAEQHAAAAENRERLARRVHDTLAHTVTVMVVQTEALRATTTLDPAGQRRVDAVLGAGRAALAEVRAALADTDSATALPSRLTMLRSAGLRLSGEAVPVELATLAAPLRAVAERLIGEAATNALRHDGPGATLTVTAQVGPEAVTLRLATTAPTSTPSTSTATAHSGFGLKSLKSDIEGYGGELTYGPGSPSGWRIEARLPVPRMGDGRTAG